MNGLMLDVLNIWTTGSARGYQSLDLRRRKTQKQTLFEVLAVTDTLTGFNETVTLLLPSLNQVPPGREEGREEGRWPITVSTEVRLKAQGGHKHVSFF